MIKTVIIVVSVCFAVSTIVSAYLEYLTNKLYVKTFNKIYKEVINNHFEELIKNIALMLVDKIKDNFEIRVKQC